MTVATLQLREPGPAQSNLIYHFCGRPPGTGTSAGLDPGIAAMTPRDRLANILWDEQLRRSVPFGATSPMICFSESPIEHLTWLLAERMFPAWALLFTRQWVYNFGGGPVWYPREQQYYAMTPEQRNWAVRFDAYNSDWLHEREWRIPVAPGYAGLGIAPGSIQAIIVEEPGWQPWRQVPEPTGWMLDEYGMPSADPHDHHGTPEMAPRWRLPPLWTAAPRFWWDRANRRFSPVAVPAPG
ncbi:hypothetical protein [Amycolatopsis magusensis]|uniref:hypothetical protein n=1 Tax=Amycolatopsis magusensis TaxID=882444 RepID=UPI0024A96E43|nr:hypothetical protein [Amycolatopsis magusensis]MDI5978241.1 hypothetical protein [Amycolatopsis magusensis]